MRPGASFNATTSTPHTAGSHSPWHSPVPYLFGGLAAMLGLIAFALLILACSYWKLSGYLDSAENDSDPAEPGKPEAAAGKPEAALYEERIVVIMAGDVKPTFLATPISSRASSFGNHTKDGNGNGNGDGNGEGDGSQKRSDGKETETETASGDSNGTHSETRNGDHQENHQQQQ